MGQAFTRQLFAGLLSLARCYRRGELTKTAYVSRIQQLFAQAGAGDWYARRFRRAQVKSSGACYLPRGCMRLLASAAKRGLMPRRLVAGAWVRHARCLAAEAVDEEFECLKRTRLKAGCKVCLVITDAAERGAGAPPLHRVVRELQKDGQLVTCIVGESAEAQELAAASSICLRLAGGSLEPDSDERYGSLNRLADVLNPHWVLTDTLSIYSEKNSARFKEIPSVATLYRALDFPPFYVWEGVHQNIRRRQLLLESYLWTNCVVYADADIAASYRERFVYDVPEPLLLAPPAPGAEAVRQYAHQLSAWLQEALRQDARERELAARIERNRFPLWRHASVRNQLARCRTRIEPLKPWYGFHPLKYAEEHGLNGCEAIEACLEAAPPLHNYPSVNVETLRAGAEPSGLRVALHIHVYYPEILEDMLQRMGENALQCSLFLSTREETLESCRDVCARYGISADIRVFPNVGRDIAPFLTGFAGEWTRFDIVGHVHTKKSPQCQASQTKALRDGLYSTLLGHQGFAAMDRVITHMAQNPDCGLFFADLPRCPEWTANYGIAQNLMEQMGYERALPHQLLFPIGTMFWCRPAALRALFRLETTWQDYPPEPLDIDGTWLHALERLFPLIVEQEGYHYAVGYIDDGEP